MDDLLAGAAYSRNYLKFYSPLKLLFRKITSSEKVTPLIFSIHYFKTTSNNLYIINDGYR